MISFRKISDSLASVEPFACQIIDKANNLDNDYFGEPKETVRGRIPLIGTEYSYTKSIDPNKIRIFIFTRLAAIPAAVVAIAETTLLIASLALALLATVATLGSIDGSKDLMEILFVRAGFSGAMIPISILSILIPSLNIK